MDSARLSNENSGIIPESGVFSIKRWAVFFDCDCDTIRRWIQQYEVPFFKPGKMMYIDARDFMKRIPYHNREEE